MGNRRPPMRPLSLAVAALLASTVTGCASTERSQRRTWNDRPYGSSRSYSTSGTYTGRTEAPRNGDWPSIGRTAAPAPKQPLAVGLLTRDGALQTIREA